MQTRDKTIDTHLYKWVVSVDCVPRFCQEMYMSRHLSPSRREVRETVRELRRHLGLFSFQDDVPSVESSCPIGSSPELGVRPGGIVEWLVERQGAGAETSALHIMARSCGGGVWAVVDRGQDCYFPAFSGWGIDPSRILVLRPVTLQETWWAIEQCLRCPGVSATWAWVDQRIPDRVYRRWQLAAEVGGGVGLFFRPVWAQREPIWADLRLLATPQAGGQGETRRMRIDVLYRQGGLGGRAQVWEIDHAAGHVRLVPEVANSKTTERKARA
jgi:protein ImuA